jgi:cell division protein FtsW (lipid II flippase)
VLVTAVASVGVLMLWSIAGGDFEVWARPQTQVFIVGMGLMFIVALVPIWFWRSMAGMAYLVAFLLLVYGRIRRRVGMGAQRWIDLRLHAPAAFRDDEVRAGDAAGRLLRLAGRQERCRGRCGCWCRC